MKIYPKILTIRKSKSISQFGQGGPITLNQQRLSRLLILLTGALLLAPAMGYCMTMNPADPCQGAPTAGPCTGVDDDNTSTLHPFPASPITDPAKQGILNSGMDAFDKTHTGWHYQWDGTDIALVDEGIKILDYYAWVVKYPATIGGNGQHFNGRPGVDDKGGAVFNLSYMPVADAPKITDLRWVQAYDGSLYGKPKEGLDNPFDHSIPFYDPKGTAGKLANGGGWFLDEPSIPENEIESNPVADLSFQVALAGFNATTKTVTFYGGYDWGFTYTTEENPPFSTPEAGNTLDLLFVGVIGIIILSRTKGFSPRILFRT